MRAIFVAAVLGLVASVAAAAGTPSHYVRKTTGPVLALAADGDRASFIVQGRSK
jgi:hypothetical protein